jgi:acetolactate synthase I/II/III large subunit
MNGARWLVHTLRERGVSQIFVLCGNGLNPFLDACFEYGMKVIDVRNEQAAAYMADAWGRMTGQLGVVAVGSGPGHTNTVTGVANAFWDGGPMLLISACSAQDTRGLDHFQELDQVSLVAPLCKYAAMVRHVAALPYQVTTALETALAGRPGPVHLTIPVDVLEAPVHEPSLPRVRAEPLTVSPQGIGDPALIRQAVALLAAATRPFMVVGSGAFYAQAWEPLAELAGLVNLPIVSHIWDRGCVERAIPQYMGVTNDELNEAMASLSQADLILTVGARIDYRLWHGRPPQFPATAKVIRIDAEPAEVNRTVVADVGIVGNPRVVLE